jgi:hypothetical protein
LNFPGCLVVSRGVQPPAKECIGAYENYALPL